MPMTIVAAECTKCGACMMACPRRAVEETALPGGVYTYRVDREKCTGCEDEPAPLCQGECPVPECLILT